MDKTTAVKHLTQAIKTVFEPIEECAEQAQMNIRVKFGVEIFQPVLDALKACPDEGLSTALGTILMGLDGEIDNFFEWHICDNCTALGASVDAWEEFVGIVFDRRDELLLWLEGRHAATTR